MAHEAETSCAQAEVGSMWCVHVYPCVQNVLVLNCRFCHVSSWACCILYQPRFYLTLCKTSCIIESCGCKYAIPSHCCGATCALYHVLNLWLDLLPSSRCWPRKQPSFCAHLLRWRLPSMGQKCLVWSMLCNAMCPLMCLKIFNVCVLVPEVLKKTWCFKVWRPDPIPRRDVCGS